MFALKLIVITSRPAVWGCAFGQNFGLCPGWGSAMKSTSYSHPLPHRKGEVKAVGVKNSCQRQHELVNGYGPANTAVVQASAITLVMDRTAYTAIKHPRGDNNGILSCCQLTVATFLGKCACCSNVVNAIAPANCCW